jgi:flavin reductase (DIM6/NTAB) family NADH-FMN oxidoreductase RutF
LDLDFIDAIPPTTERLDAIFGMLEHASIGIKENSAVPVSGDLYKQLGRNAAGPVCIAAAYDRATGAVAGLTASSFVTLSFDPPMVMFAIQQHADSYASIVSSKAFGVSLLGRKQSQIASLFATKGREKIERTPFSVGGTLQVPLIRDSLAEIECLTSQVFVSGDHAIVVGLVEAVRTRSGGDPLLYFDGQFGSFARLSAVDS